MTHPGEALNHPTDRPQTVHNGRRPSEDSHRPSSTVRRVTVPEAADILGTTTDAVRSRIRRGKLRREEGGDGTVYVLLDDVHDSPTSAKDGRETGGNQTVGNGRETVDDGPLVERMASEIDHLRGQLEEAQAANRENRRIIAALTQRIPELEAPREAPREALLDERGSPVTGSEESSSTAPPNEERPSWWRRFFGVE
jgi:hypothetical protein